MRSPADEFKIQAYEFLKNELSKLRESLLLDTQKEYKKKLSNGEINSDRYEHLLVFEGIRKEVLTTTKDMLGKALFMEHNELSEQTTPINKTTVEDLAWIEDRNISDLMNHTNIEPINVEPSLYDLNHDSNSLRDLQTNMSDAYEGWVKSYNNLVIDGKINEESLATLKVKNGIMGGIQKTIHDKLKFFDK